jgi:creatinine amidohydrolase
MTGTYTGIDVQRASMPAQEVLSAAGAAAKLPPDAMRLWDANWLQIEDYLARDDRVLVPLGSTEQHGYLSLGVDALICERGAVEAAHPEGVPVLPVIPFGLTPGFTAFPGTVHIRVATYLALVRDVLDSLAGQGFRRILLVNGHGGNAPAATVAQEWVGENPEAQVLFHGFLLDPDLYGMAAVIDHPGHASWAENFPFVRVDGVEIPSGRKPPVDMSGLATAHPARVRAALGDGVGGGAYQRPAEDGERVWQAAVALLRDRLAGGWT